MTWEEISKELFGKKTEKRFTVIDHNEWSEGDIIYYDNGKEMGWMDVCDKLNELHEENEFLKSNYKELVQFVKSKGYTLKDFISFIGQFQSVGVNKEDWE